MSIEYYFTVGNDNGNSDHKIVINGELITQPNVMAKVNKLPMLDEVNPEYVVKNIESNLIVTIASPSVAPSIYYVGDYARKSRERLRNIKVGMENSKVDSDVIVVNTLAQISGYAVKKAYKENKELNKEIIVNVDMVTALPVTQYNSNNVRIFTNKFMKDKHDVKVHVGNKTVDVKVKFNFVKVLPESVPIVFYLQRLNQNRLKNTKDAQEKERLQSTINKIFKDFKEKYNLPNIDGSYFKNKKILHIAIGEGTTEYPLTDDISFNPEFIEGSNNGTGHAIEEAIKPFKNKFKLRNFTRQDFSAILRDKEHKYYDDAMDFVESHLMNEAEDILNYAKDEVEKANNDVDIICVHGGGSILMKDYLYDELSKFGEETRIKIFYIPEEFAVNLETLGMYEFAKSKIFKMLKDKYINSNKEVATTK